jgi:hypothetical protein
MAESRKPLSNFSGNIEREFEEVRRLRGQADDALEMVRHAQELIESTRKTIQLVDEQIPIKRLTSPNRGMT